MLKPDISHSFAKDQAASPPAADQDKPKQRATRSKKRKHTEIKFDLNSYEKWRTQYPAIRRWLVERIAERAIEIYEAEKRASQAVQVEQRPSK